MRYLFWLALGLAVWWWLRQQRLQGPGQDAPSQGSRQDQHPMVPCAECNLHVPQNDAVRGTRGWYCCEAHRRQREG